MLLRNRQKVDVFRTKVANRKDCRLRHFTPLGMNDQLNTGLWLISLIDRTIGACRGRAARGGPLWCKEPILFTF